MKPTLTSTSVFLYLLFLCFMASADLDLELKKTVEEVMKCQYHEPPKGPVMALTPMRFMQVVVILHQKFSSPTCGQTPKSPIRVADEKTWPFCVFGRCVQGICMCADNFRGSKCGSYTKKCWLMYCYLTSCHPLHQSLHCICDPRLYGTPVASGIYWYNEGKSSKYVAPPAGWIDEPTEVIKLKNNAAMQMGATGKEIGGVSSVQGSQGSAQGSRRISGGTLLQNPRFKAGTFQDGTLTNQKTGGKVASNDKVRNGGSIGGETGDIIKESDVKEALDELEDVPNSSKLISPGINLLIVIGFSMQWIHRRYIT